MNIYSKTKKKLKLTVLPDPVCAQATISSCCRIQGIVYRWIGVGSSKWARRILDKTCVPRLASSYNSIGFTLPY